MFCIEVVFTSLTVFQTFCAVARMSNYDRELNMVLIEAHLRTFSMAMLLYDHLLTFDDEILYIWTPRWNKSTFLFLLNRYFGLAMNVLAVICAHCHWTSKTFGTCYKLNTFHLVSFVLVQGISCLIISLRTYALYGCSKRIMWCLLTFFSALIAAFAWSMTVQSVAEDGIMHQMTENCHLFMDRPTAVRLAICWEAVFAFDTTIFVLTLYKTWQTRHSVVTLKPISLLGVLLRDGAAYFMFMALANLANIFTFYIGPPFLRGRLSSFASCLAVALVSRMMLNLHRVQPENGVMFILSGVKFKTPQSEEEGDKSLAE
ncbi:hypothetical protein DL96DRAFT_523509 [Flagelloscypha sp. PMI_526]|nr:hypothetical protein DL96DRAFT_523509 [Flagelloscypha sp. PMI_526]